MLRIVKELRRRKGKGKKGQMYLLGALVMVGILVILKYNIAYPSAVGEKKVLEVRFENDIFNNLLNEFNNTLRFSYDGPLDITKNVFDFANFTEAKIIEHSLGFKFLFVGSVANETTDLTNVTLINMLDVPIDASLTFDGQSDERKNIQNHESWDASFGITPGTTYTLTLAYNETLTYNETVENITIKTKKNKDVYVGFFYISLESSDAFHRISYQKDMNLPEKDKKI